MEKYVINILIMFLITLVLSILLIVFNFIICLPVILLVVVTIGLLIYSVSKKYLIGVFKNEDAFAFRQKVVQTLHEQGYKIIEKEEKVYIEKGALTATSLYFKQHENSVEVYRTNTATTTSWVLFIIGFFTVLILSIVIGLLSETNSKSFAEETIIPLLKNQYEHRRCPNCGRLIPADALVCPYCAKRST